MIGNPSQAVARLSGDFQVQLDPREAVQLSAALWLGPLAFVYLGGLVTEGLRTPAAYLGPFLGTSTGVLIAFGLYRLVGALVGRPRWQAHGAMVAAVFVCAVAQAACDYAFNVVLGLVPPPTFSAHDRRTIVVVVLLYLSLYATNLALIWLTSANRALRAQTVRAAQAEADNLRAELTALRLKLDPHFMFNALTAANGVAAAGGSRESQEMLLRLSDFLRSSLDVGLEDIPLEDELSLLDNYLEVERVRFPDRLRVAMTIQPEAERARVPSLLLQPLVENAVKYGVAPTAAPVTIAVSAWIDGDRLRIVITDDGRAGPGRLGKGLGVGLAATRSRLRLRYGDQARFEAGPADVGYRVEIDLPFEVVEDA